MEIALSADELEMCRTFAIRCAESQQAIEFGQHDTAQRGLPEISRDNMIGKIAEVAFAKMMRTQYGLDVPLDFDYYPRGKWDAQDTVVNGWRIDIKATRQGGRWMLIEWSKLNFRFNGHGLPHLFVIASVGWNREQDIPTGRVDLIGCVTLFKLQDGVATTRVLHKGECIPGTSTTLQADNFAILFSDLRQDWSVWIPCILSNPAPSLDGYRNPVTGCPYREQQTLCDEDNCCQQRTESM